MSTISLPCFLFLPRLDHAAIFRFRQMILGAYLCFEHLQTVAHHGRKKALA